MGITDFGELQSGQLGDCNNKKLDFFAGGKVICSKHYLLLIKFVILVQIGTSKYITVEPTYTAKSLNIKNYTALACYGHCTYLLLLVMSSR